MIITFTPIQNIIGTQRPLWYHFYPLIITFQDIKEICNRSYN